MENSSKALMIAGAVLITILLITLGINLFDSTSNLSSKVESTTQSTEAANFNAQFTSHFGKSVPGYKVKDFIHTIMKHNAKVSSAPTFSAESHQIHLNLYSSPGSLVYRS